ncbi:MAG TPA: 50S ribosomal protein L17, partial [Patescibacteria group bacterium]
MRHRKKKKILDRNKSARQSLLRNLAGSLVLYEKIKTTEAKARAVRSVVEKYITVGKKNDLHSRRQLLKFFYTENQVKKVLEVLGPRYKERPGGYTRIVKLGQRAGDGAKVV